ncbi:Receptor-like protein kinase HSL1 [Linum perenne]
MSQNLLAGSIPGSLADLPDLRQLDLQGNSFSGKIPSKFGEFRRLEWISLTGNLLTGTIPPQIGNITTLKQLLFSYNPYSAGLLPSELGNLLNLEDLWRLNQLRRFDASMNQLTGTIPDELCRLELESLNLFKNRLLWDIPLRFQLRMGALTEFGQLMELLDRGMANRISAGPPTLVWPLSTSSTFTVKSFNSKLRLQHFPGSLTVPISTIWSRCVPTKIQGFVWLCFLNRIMTIDNLKGRGFQMPNRCSLCFGQEESVSHIFRLCPFSSRVWRKLSSKLSCSGPFAAEVQDFISSWKGMNCVAPFELAKKVIIHSFFWFIWLERNNRIFRDSLESEVQVVFRIWLACGRWLKAFSLWSQQDFEKWMRQLNAT